MKAIRTLLACIRKADQTYNLIQHGDKIVIGLSGGKDSIALTYCLSLYRKFSHTDFKIQPVVLNLGFPGFNPQPLIEFCRSLDLDLIISDNTDVYKILEIQKENQNSKHLPCSICSRMKKAAINKVAKEIGFNKVAFAHHAEDAIETLFMNEIYGGRVATFSPKMHLEKADIEFIRPLIHVRESDIKKLIREENLPVVGSRCPADKTTTRETIKNILDGLYKEFPKAKESFLSMLSNYEHEDLWNDKIYLQVDQEGLALKPIVDKIDAFAAYDIRNKVFCMEQNVPYDLEIILDEEKEAHNYLIMLGETPIGHIRYRALPDNKYKVERFCILKEYREKGRGRKVFNYFLDMLGAKYNPCTVCFDGQFYLKDFYESCGCVTVGDTFMEAGIEHVYMEKKY